MIVSILTLKLGGDEGDRFTLQLMAAASKFSLQHLVDTCEQALVSSVRSVELIKVKRICSCSFIITLIIK